MCRGLCHVLFFQFAASFRGSIIGRVVITFASHEIAISFAARVTDQTTCRSVIRDIAERFDDFQEQ
jgi:hypothetical protein